MQMLFQADIGRQTADQVRRTFWGARETIDPGTQSFAEDIFDTATTRQEEIDQSIEQASRNWRIERMAAVDRNLLRAAIAEMLAFPATPAAIIIDETIEIARLYSAPESVPFLNGILDTVSRGIRENMKSRFLHGTKKPQ